MDCLYTFFKYRFSGKDIAKSGQVFDNVQRAVDFNLRNKGVDRMPSIAKKRLLRKNTKSICSAFFKRQKQRRPVVLLKNVDCFLDGHDNVDSILVSFEAKSL